MKFSNCLPALLFLLISTSASSLFSAEKIYVADERRTINIDFKDLEIEDFIKLVSRVTNKNVLLDRPIRGKIEFISSTPIYKENLLEILISILESKGYTLIDQGEFYGVVRGNEAAKYNLPVLAEEDTSIKQLITVSIRPKVENVDVITSKIMHLVSKSAKVVTMKENNTILITDYPKNIQTIRSVIEMIDETQRKEVRFVELQHAEVAKIYNNVNQLAREMFKQDIPSERVQVIQDPDTNSIVIVGKPSNLVRMQKIIDQFDREIPPEESEAELVKILTLKHSEAVDVAKVIKDIVNTKKYDKPELKPRISQDESKNAIVIVGAAESIREVLEIVEQLDTEKQQVFVQAQIIEINVNKAEQLGAQWGLEGGILNSGGLYTMAANLGGSSFVLDSLSSFLSTSTVSSGLALGAGLNLLKSNNAAETVSEPSILAVDNKESSIYVGQTESILTSSVSGDNETDLTRNTFTREDIGLSMKVKPRISQFGKVALEVETKLEDVIQGSGSVSGTPTTTKREVSTNAIVNNGESVIIGGLIRGSVSGTTTKIPFLGDIPVIGSIFRNDTTDKDRTNLVIILTPYMIDKSSGLAGLRENLTRLNWLQRRYNRMIVEELEKRKNGELDEDELYLMDVRREIEE